MSPIEKQKLAIRIAWLAGTFSTIVGIILLLNYWQLKRSDPVESKIMESLVSRFDGDRQNESLKEDIRNLDLMTRKAYFTKQWQIRAGSYMLIGGMVIMVIALRVFRSTEVKIAEPTMQNRSLRAEQFLLQRWILTAMLLLFAAALFAAFFSDDHLSSSYNLAGSKGTVPEQTVEETSIIPAGGEQEEPGTSAVTGNEEPVTEENKINSGSEQPEQSEPPEEILEDDPAPDEPEVQELALVSSGSNELMNDFSSFRGPLGLGISKFNNPPVEWDGPENKNIVWKVEVPFPGYNSPVIWGDDLFLTGADDANQFVYCYNRHSGEIRWQHQVAGIQRPAGKIRKPTEDTGYAAPTAATDGNHVAAIFASGDVVCLDRKGNRLWAKNLGIPDNHYGHSSSLLIWNDLLLIQFDGNSGGKVIALEISTGAEKWSTNRKSKISWASPILIEVDGNKELILSSSPHVAAYDPLTGREIWAVECLTGEVGPSPAFADGMVFAANEYANLVAIRPGNPPEVRWETNEYLPEVSSPVARGGLLFLGTSYGVIACYDDRNGELIWEYECDQGIYASPIIAGDYVYFLDMDGIMHIFSTERTLNLIGEPQLGEGAVATPAFTDGRIYLRGDEHLFCIGK